MGKKIEQANYRSDKKTEYDFTVKSESVHYGFAVKDPKGRAIGARLQTRVLTYTEKTEPDPRGWYTVEPGTYFALRPHATRDGAPYGAAQSELLFKTDADRLEYIKVYLDGARKRAMKIAGITGERFSVAQQRQESGERAGDR